MISGMCYMWVCRSHIFRALVSELILWVLWVDVVYVVVVLKAMSVSVFLNSLVIFLSAGCDMWMWSRFFVFFFRLCTVEFFDVLADLVSWVGFVENCCFGYCLYYIPLFFSESNGREHILETWNLNAAILCSMGVVREKVNRSVCGGWFSACVNSETCLFSFYCQA